MPRRDIRSQRVQRTSTVTQTEIKTIPQCASMWEDFHTPIRHMLCVSHVRWTDHNSQTLLLSKGSCYPESCVFAHIAEIGLGRCQGVRCSFWKLKS